MSDLLPRADVEALIAEKNRRLDLIQPFIKLKRQIAMHEQPTWVIDPCGQWVKIKRGLPQWAMVIDEDCDKAIDDILNRKAQP